MLLGTLGVSLLGNLLAGKGVIATRQEWGTIRAGKGKIRAGKGTVRSGPGYLMPSHPLANLEIQKYYKNEP